MLTIQCKGMFTNALPCLYHKENAPSYGNNNKIRFVCSNVTFSLILFFTQYIRDSPLSAVTVSLHCLPKMSAFNSHMLQNAYYGSLKWTFEGLLVCYCYATKTSSRIIRSQVLQPASAGKRTDMSKLQAHHCMTPEDWIWLLCSASIIPANKLSLQKLYQLVGIKLLTSGFLEIFGS